MTHQTQLEKAKYINWVKGGLSMKYLKDGLEKFADDVVREDHTRILQQIRHTTGLICKACTLRDLKPVHSFVINIQTGEKSCLHYQSNCNCLYPNKTSCPNEICDAIYEEILNSHASSPPAPCWKNTDITKWVTHPWEVAKCFINAPGYRDKQSAEEIDVAGLLHVFINNKMYQRSLSCSGNKREAFSKALDLRNKIFNSPNMELELQDLNECLTNVVSILEDEKILMDTKYAKEAVDKVKQLQDQELIITTETEVITLREIVEQKINNLDIRNSKLTKEHLKLQEKHLEVENRQSAHKEKHSELEDKHKKLEKRLSALDKKHSDLSKEIFELKKTHLKPEKEHSDIDQGLSNVEILKNLHQQQLIPLEKHIDYLKLTWVIQQFEDEPDLKQIMQEDKIFGPSYLDILDSDGELGMFLPELWLLEKLKVCLKYAYLADDILYDVEENLCEKQKLHFWRRGEWNDCLKNRDLIGILDLLQIGQYPDQNQLRMLCMSVGRKHPLTKLVCVRISDFIREHNQQLSSENIIRPVYEARDENEIIFLIDDESTKKINFDKINVTIELRNLKSPNSENEQVIQYELDDNIELDYEMMDQMEKYIHDHSESLCKEHSNIIMITASPVKSIGYKKDKIKIVEQKHSIKQLNCIVLFVPAKGLIPLQEDCFPKMLGSFQTDVREGYCELLVGGGPLKRHQNLKLGCAIGIQSERKYGTLGGFVNHPSYGLCAVTCAHVVLTDEEKENSLNFRTKTFVQPHKGDEFGIVEKEMYEYSSGKDAALIKITRQERKPLDGDFPDCTEKERHSAGFDGNEEMLYRSGDILMLDKSNRAQYKNFRLVKFGAATSIRRGLLRSLGLSFPYGRREEKMFKNQMQILPFKTGEIFADAGDSGSFVFIVTDKTEFLLIGMLIGRGNGFWIVTPINDVLAALDCNAESLKVFVPTIDRDITNGNINGYT